MKDARTKKPLMYTQKMGESVHFGYTQFLSLPRPILHFLQLTWKLIHIVHAHFLMHLLRYISVYTPYTVYGIAPHKMPFYMWFAVKHIFL